MCILCERRYKNKKILISLQVDYDERKHVGVINASTALLYLWHDVLLLNNKAMLFQASIFSQKASGETLLILKSIYFDAEGFLKGHKSARDTTTDPLSYPTQLEQYSQG